jgi:Flp pilus assembly protein TadG
VKVKILRGESGQTLVFAALFMACLMGFVALSVDVGLMLREKRVVQTAADSAAIAGAAELISGTWAAAALADAAQNGVTNGVNGATVTPHNGPSSGPHAGNLAYVEVIVTQPQPTFFMKVFSFGSMAVSARAVATNVPTPSCIYTLSSASPNTSDSPPGGVYVTGSADLELPTCGIVDNATGVNAVHVTGGATLNSTAIGVVGTYTVHNGGVLTPNPPATGMTAVSDPLSSLAPTVPTSDYSTGCLADPKLTKSATIGPSSPTGFVCYTGFSISKGSPTITLNPGLYIFNGTSGFNIASGTTMTGSGVTFYFVNGASFTISNGASLTVSAPTSGPYSGYLFYQNPADTAADSFVGGSAGGINGIFYLPNAPLTLANGTATTFNVDLVVGSLAMTGNATLRPYAPLTGTSPLSTPRLVE